MSPTLVLLPGKDDLLYQSTIDQMRGAQLIKIKLYEPFN